MKSIVFDRELAKLAIAAGTGRIRTVDGGFVEIINWNTPHGICGKISYSSLSPSYCYSFMHWTEEGKLLNSEEEGLNLIIESYIDI